MATLGMVVANDLANQLLQYYVREDVLSQTTQDKPLLKILRENKEAFPGGLGQVSVPVQGVYMSDTPGFLQGFREDDSLNFNQAQNATRASYPWLQVHAGLEITYTELLKDGISISENEEESEHKNASVVRITSGVFKNRIQDYTESWARTTNLMFWQSGAQDPKQIPGIKGLLTDTPATGTTGGIDRAANIWWRHRTLIGSAAITASAENQTLSKTLRSEYRQLTRYGMPKLACLCGSKFIDALELEVQEKGLYTQEGFVNEGKTDIGLAKIKMRDVGVFMYDPTLDDIGEAKRCYMIDTKRIKWRPIDKEDGRLWTPARPYNYFVLFKSMTTAGCLVATQLNTSAIYEVN